jgi:hypothetical protein
MTVAVEGYEARRGESMSFLTNRVTDRYFATMGIPIVRGRPIDATDREDARRVVVVNEAFARRFWNAGDPLGRRVTIDGSDATVVDVAADGKYFFLDPLDAPSRPFVYLPFAQSTYFSVVLHARVAGNPLALMPSIQRAVTSVDSRFNAISPATLEDYSAAPFVLSRLASRVLSTLGVAALLLATVGLYAVTAYAVTQQRREIGIRMALGATPARIVGQFLAHGARYAGVGALAGAILAAAIAKGLASGVPGSVPRVATDRVGSFVIATAALALVAALAAWIPAQRAARVNPTTALREE